MNANENNIELFSLITLREIVETLYKRKDIDEAVKQSIRNYMKQ